MIVAKVVSAASMGSLVIGHQALNDGQIVELSDASLEVLKPQGVINILRPYANCISPFSIAADKFEQVLKHHCVVNMNITVYDGMTISLPVTSPISSLSHTDQGVAVKLMDAHSEWSVNADRMVNTANLPQDLNGAIVEGAAIAGKILHNLPYSI